MVSLPHRIADQSVFLTENAADVQTKRMTSKRILLAEDNDLNAEIAMELLKDAGFEMDRAQDGEVCGLRLRRIGDEPVHIAHGAKVMAVYLANLAAVAQKDVLGAVGEHHAAQMRFLIRGIGNPLVARHIRHAAAGKEKHIRVEPPDEILGIAARVGGRIVQQAPARTVHRVLVKRLQFDRRLESVGDDGD